MAETKDADAAYAEIVAKMPQPLADMYWRFSNQYCYALEKWQEFDELFSSPQQVDLLNQAAPAFFASLQRTLFLDLVMDVGRFTDPPEMGQFRNLSLAQLENAVPDAQVRAALNALHLNAKAKCKPVRDYRNIQQQTELTVQKTTQKRLKIDGLHAASMQIQPSIMPQQGKIARLVAEHGLIDSIARNRHLPRQNSAQTLH